MRDKKVLDKFGRTLMCSVRDRSINNFEGIITGHLKSQRCLELHSLSQCFNVKQQEVLRKLVIETIDNTIFNFLFMLEEHDENKMIVSGIDINQISDGISGELFTEDGWIFKFSTK